MDEEERQTQKEAHAAQALATGEAIRALESASQALEEMAAAMMAKAWREPGLAQMALGLSAQVDTMVMALK